MDKLTIIFPTKNRHHFLKMVLEYYAQNKCQFPIVIGDASDKEVFEQNRRLVEGLKGRLNIDHQAHPLQLSSQASVVRSLEMIKTPYSVFSGDDDFFVPACLQECVDFLDENPDYNLASGEFLMAYVKRTPQSRYEMDKIVFGDFRRSVLDNSARARLIQSYYPRQVINTFSVQRTKNILHMYKKILHAGLDADMYGNILCEVAANGLSLIYGKEMKLPRLYIVALKHGEQLYQSRAAGLNSISRITFEYWPLYLKKVIQLLTDALMEKDSIPLDEAQSIAETCILYYHTNVLMLGYPTDVLKEHGITFVSSQHGIGRLLFNKVAARFPFLKNLKQRLRPSKAALPNLLNPKSPYHADFMPIYSSFEK